MKRMRWSIVAVIAVAVAFAWPQQGAGWEENAHLALVLALADGTPYVEDVLSKIGGLGTGDLAERDGHKYAITAPGHPAASLPMYVLLERLGVRTTGDPTQLLWAIGLTGVVLPAFLLVLLVHRAADRLTPGYGTATAVTLGLGTLLLPFASFYMAHALSAFLVFAAFALLWREREGRERLVLVAGGGLLAGLAVVSEYYHVIAVAVLGVYALARSRSPVRIGAYAGGVAAGVAPTALYHQWAFGSPFHVAYQDGPNRETFEKGFLGIGKPSGETFGALLEMLFSEQGLVVLSPVAALGVAGTVLLFRRGLRAEALVIGAIAGLYLVYASAYFTFGGIWPGPRYLIVALPFLLTAAAVAFRALPLTTISLAVLSTSIMVALTATHAHAAYQQRWFERVLEREFPTTALTSIGITGWYSILPFFVAALAALIAAARTLPAFEASTTDVLASGAAIAGWTVLALGAPRRGELGGSGLEVASYWPVAVVALAGLVAFAVLRLRTGTRAAGVTA